MPDLLLVNSNRSKPAIAPIALDYLASAVRQHGFTVDLLDLCFADDPAQAIDGYFARSDGNLLAVAVTFRNTDDVHYGGGQSFLPQIKEVAERIQRNAQAPVVLGGAGFSAMPEAVLAYCSVDLGVWGEGEHALPELLRRLQRKEDLDGVPGLVQRTPAGYRRSPPAYIDLGLQPTPARDVVDSRRYFAEGGQGGVETKRGCPMRCVYCADPLGKGSRVRLRAPESVADEVEQLLALGVDQLHLCDSEFNLPAWHAEAVCRELVRRGLGSRIRWYAYCAPAPFDADLARLLLRSGCAGVNFGADSGGDDILRALGRHFTAADVERTAQICHQEGLVFMFDLLLGGPGETRETLRQTIELMRRLAPDRVGAALGVRLFPGTALAALVQSQGPLKRDPNLRGAVAGNESFLEPIYYVSAGLGEDPEAYLDQLIGDDERFFRGSKRVGGQSYNYSDNRLLVDAIREGYRGAYWDILRRLAEGG